MRFAVLLPWWGYVLLFGAAIALGWLAYARVPVRLAPSHRLGLSALRAATLLALLAILLRPVVTVPPASANNSLVPVLVDVSRSMRLTDGNGPSRLEQAKALAARLQQQLGTEYRLEILAFGEALAPVTTLDQLTATARYTTPTGYLEFHPDLVTPPGNGKSVGALHRCDIDPFPC